MIVARSTDGLFLGMTRHFDAEYEAIREVAEWSMALDSKSSGPH